MNIVTRCIAGAAITCTFAATAIADEPLTDRFDGGELGTMPPHWFVPPALTQRGVTAELTSDNPFVGEHCLKLHGPPGAGFTNVMRVIDATPYRDQRITFSAAVRVEPGTRAQLWIRVDREDGGRGLFDNMHERPILDAEWREYEITGNIADDADTINIGLMLPQGGTAWLDNVVISMLGAVPQHHEPARELTDRGLTNLIALTRMLGYVRYFHPSDEAAETDWDAWTINAVRRVEDAEDDSHLVSALRDVVQPIAPALTFHHGKIPPIEHHHLNPRRDKPDQVVRWKHFGVSSHLSQHEQHPGLYNSQRQYDSLRRVNDDERPLIIERTLAPRVRCHLPIDLYVKDGRTLPRSEGDFDPTADWPEFWSPTAKDRATRIAGVMLAWSVFQHFYPYFDVVDTDWEVALADALRAAAIHEGEREHLNTLRKLIAKLHDGHGHVIHTGSFASNPLPIMWDWVGEELVITKISEHVEHLAQGDVVLAIDGRPMNEIYREVSSTISGATPQWIRHRALQMLRTEWPMEAPAMFTVRCDDGTEEDVAIDRVSLERKMAGSSWVDDDLNRPDSGSELAPGIIYINLNGLDDLNQYLPALREADGIIFDVRGYPGQAGVTVMHHLTDQRITSPQWHIPQFQLPDREDMTFQRMPGWPIQPRQPRLTDNVAFLTDGRAISYAESCMGIVEHYNLGEIIGSPTAGTNGNVNPFTIPGGYTIIWTGMKVLKHDGSQHHGIGIQPTVPASRTIEGIRNSRDEVLEKAIEVLTRE